MKNASRLTGIIEVLASGFCFGFLGLFGKRALSQGVTPGELLALRYTLASFLLFLIVLTRYRWFEGTYKGFIRKLWPDSKSVVTCLALGVLGYAVFSSFYFYALQSISASMTVILLYTYPALVTLGGIIFLGEKVGGGKRWAIPVAILGMILLVAEDLLGHQARADGSGVGIVFGFLSALFYSIYILVSSHRLKGLDPWVSTVWIQLGAGLILSIHHFDSISRVTEVVQRSGWDLVLLAFVCSVMAMTLFLSGLLKIQSWEASLLSMAEPVTGVLVGVFVLGESLTLSQWTGASFVLLALGIVSRPEKLP